MYNPVLAKLIHYVAKRHGVTAQIVDGCYRRSGILQLNGQSRTAGFATAFTTKIESAGTRERTIQLQCNRRSACVELADLNAGNGVAAA